MMRDPILITGATGFVGRYLLRELIASGHRVVALVRGADRAAARHRLNAAMSQLGVALPAETQIVAGSLTQRPFVADREDLARLRSCRTAIHAAASVSFRPRANGEPYRSNVEGTQRLFETLVPGGRLEHWVQLSTAYAIGRPADMSRAVDEHTPPTGRFRNPYEASKWQAEQWLRRHAPRHSVRLTICRPSIVVGEYDSGRTFSYEGFYRPLRLFRLLARRARCSSAEDHPAWSLRLELCPQGPRNLVPVDWVARQVVALASLAEASKTPPSTPEDRLAIFQLVPARPTRNAEVVDAVRAVWGNCGLGFSEPVPPARRNRWERLFYTNLREIGAYWSEEITFDDRRLIDALGPEAACPVVDQAAVERLLRFADADHWGTEPHRVATCDNRDQTARPAEGFSCRQYIEHFLPERARQSSLRRLVQLNALVGLWIDGPGGGRWRCRFRAGQLVEVARGLDQPADVVYRGDVHTLAEVVARRCSPSAAFFDRRFDIEGDIELGLKLATIFDRFVREFPFPDSQTAAETREVAARGFSPRDDAAPATNPERLVSPDR